MKRNIVFINILMSIMLFLSSIYSWGRGVDIPTVMFSIRDFSIYNPATIGLMHNPRLIMEVSQISPSVSGIYEHSLGYITPLGFNYGTIGFFISGMRSEGLYVEENLILSYAYNLKRLFRFLPFSVGFSIKSFNRSYEIIDEWTRLDKFMFDKRKYILSLDSGIIIKLKKITFSSSLRNINQPYSSLIKDEYREVLTMNIGMKWYFNENTFIVSGFEYDNYSFQDKIKIGMEHAIYNLMRIRGDLQFVNLRYIFGGTGISYGFLLNDKLKMLLNFGLKFNFSDPEMLINKISLGVNLEFLKNLRLEYMAEEGALISDFENSDEWKALKGDKGGTIKFVLDSKVVHTGNYSGKIVYDFSNTEGNAGINPKIVPTSIFKIRKLKYISLWVYGDNSGHRILLVLKDKKGEYFQYKITKLNFKGWKKIRINSSLFVSSWGYKGELKGVIQFPVTIAKIAVVKDKNGKIDKGVIYIDELKIE